MATRLTNRREHRKLNRLRASIWNFSLKRQVSNRPFQPVVGITHHRRLLLQIKLSWFCAKCLRLLLARFSTLPNKASTFRITKVVSTIKTYFIKHSRLQEFKTFYGHILNSTFRSFVVGCGTLYNKQFTYKKSNVGNLKKILRISSSLVSTLECRLVSVIWRSFFSSSILTAHQIVVFGAIKVNNKFVTKAAFLLEAGNFVVSNACTWFSMQLESKQKIWNLLPFRTPSAHLEVSFVISTIMFLYKPFDVELRFPFSPKLFFIRSFYFQ